MHIFYRLLQSVNLNSIQTANKIKQQTTRTTVNQINKTRSVSEIIKKNKILTFVGIFILTKTILAFSPPHIARPEVLARNRLEKKV